MDELLLSIFPTINAAYVFIGSLVLGASGGLLGSFAVLRRQGLLSDTLAHASLPGIVVAFLIMKTKFLPGLLFGALIFGMLGAGAVYFLVNKTKTRIETAMATVLSVFFALGVVLLSYVQGLPIASQAGLNDFLFGNAAGLLKVDVLWMLGVFLLILAVVLLFWKELSLFIFDKEFAGALGFRRGTLELIFNGIFVLTILISLQAVGVILTAAVFITPAMAAYMWTHRFSKMVLLSTVFGMLGGGTGAYMSATLPDLPTGPVIVLALSAIFVVSFLFAPRKGIVLKGIKVMKRSNKIHFENIVARFYREYENGKRTWSKSDCDPLLVRRGLLEQKHGDFVFLKKGVQLGAESVEKHRLWETYLVNKWRLAADHVHRDAHEIEHILTDDVVKELHAILGRPKTDPHGKPIKVEL